MQHDPSKSPETMEYNRDMAISSTAVAYDKNEKTRDYVHHSEVPSETGMRVPCLTHRSFVAKLGLWNVIVLIAGAVASSLAMAFLALLWAGSESARQGQNTPKIWFTIAEMGWATRVVTVASVLIRLATAAQMGVFAALVAAWILETTGATTEHLPMLSIIRTVNNGPQSHIWNVFHSLRIRSKWLYSTLVILAILDAFALQFTSTILITDFGRGTTAIIPPSDDLPISYGVSNLYGDDAGNIQPGVGVSFFRSAPSTYARFAEYKTTAHLDEDYADTGETLRAYLPFGLSEERSALRDYRGPATVVDNRVRCSRPSVSVYNVSFLDTTFATNEPYEIAIAGNVVLEGSIPGATVDISGADNPTEGEFLTSAMARIPWINNTDWRLSYSTPSINSVNFGGGLLESSNSGFPLLLINVTGNGWADLIESANFSDSFFFGPYDWKQTSSGIWTDLEPSNESLDIGFSATLCFADLTADNYAVHANAGRNFADAELRNMTWNADARTYDTKPIRKMLGVSKQEFSPGDRGIFDLLPPANWTLERMNKSDSTYLTEPILSGMAGFVNTQIPYNYPFAAQMRSYWGASPTLTLYSADSSVHRTHAALFQDVIQTTRNPALAFQALFAVLTQMVYYDLLSQFNIIDNATYTMTESVTVPRGWIGFGVVVALLILHAALVVVAVVLFLSKTDHSLLGNAWQAVAQISSGDTMDTLHHASNMTDLEVKQLLKMNNYDANEVVLKTGADGGRSQAVYRREINERY